MNYSQQLKFRTNINCNGCIGAVTQHLDNIESITSWQVDTASSEKILTVVTNAITPDEIIAAVEKAGFIIEPVH